MDACSGSEAFRPGVEDGSLSVKKVRFVEGRYIHIPEGIPIPNMKEYESGSFYGCYMTVVPMVEIRSEIERLWCERVVVPDGVREGTQGYQLRLETASVLLCRFLIIGVELRETRGDRKGNGVRARGWNEAHRIRYTPALLLCSLLGLYLWNVQGAFS